MDAIRALLDALQAGEPVILVDRHDRENEGDFVLAAELVSVPRLALILNEARGGVLCLAIEGRRLDELQIPLMCPDGDNTERNRTRFTVSVDARHGTTTGVSVADRARTIQVMLDPATRPEDLARPGHLFPLRADEAGVLGRPGHTEAAVDLCRVAGLYPAAAICEVLNPDGTMAGVPELEALAARHHLKLGHVDDLVQYLRRPEATLHADR